MGDRTVPVHVELGLAERVEERDERGLVGRVQSGVGRRGGRTLTGVPTDRLVDRGLQVGGVDAAVVEERTTGPNAPEGRGPHLLLVRRAVDDSVSEGAHVVHQEVGVGSDQAVRESGLRRGAGGERRLVAVRAADIAEDGLAAHPGLRGLRRRREEALEVGDAVDELDSLAVRKVFRIRDGIAHGEERRVAIRSVLGGDETVCDAHLVQGRVPGEGEDRRDLGLPTEAAHAERPGRVLERLDEVRHAAGEFEREEVRVGDRLDEARAEDRRGDPLGGHVRDRRDRLRA